MEIRIRSVVDDYIMQQKKILNADTRETERTQTFFGLSKSVLSFSTNQLKACAVCQGHLSICYYTET